MDKQLEDIVEKIIPKFVIDLRPSKIDGWSVARLASPEQERVYVKKEWYDIENPVCTYNGKQVYARLSPKK